MGLLDPDTRQPDLPCEPDQGGERGQLRSARGRQMVRTRTLVDAVGGRSGSGHHNTANQPILITGTGQEAEVRRGTK
jgi:hypothetical protein